MGILKNHTKRATEIRFLDLIDVNAVITDLSVCNIIETIDQVGNGSFSGASGSYKSNLLSGFGPKTDIMQNDLVICIAKVYVIKNNGPFQLGIGNGPFGFVRMLPGPQICSCLSFRQISIFIFFCIDQFYITFVSFRCLIHQIKNTLSAGCSIDHKVDLLADLGDWVCKALVQSDKGDNGTNGNSCQTVDPQDGAYDGHQGIADPADIGVYRHQQVCIAVGLVGTVSKFFVYFMEIIHSCLFMTEDFYHFLSVQHFLNKPVYNTQIHLLADIISS